MRLDPTTWPLAETKEPLAWLRNAVTPRAHTAKGKISPRSTVRATVVSRAVVSCRRSMSVHPQGGEEHVDEFDPDEGGDDAADAVDQKVPAEDGGRPHRPDMVAKTTQPCFWSRTIRPKA